MAARALHRHFIDPALAWLQARGVGLRFGHRFAPGRIAEGGWNSILARRWRWRPAMRRSCLARARGRRAAGITAPESFRAILSTHFDRRPAGWPAILGVIGGTVEWLFAFENRLSVTISGADRLIDRDREDLARELWGEVAALTGLGASLPAWQIVKERRATFAALPAEEARRPGAETRWPNLRLAGDWTATGLPATIEGDPLRQPGGESLVQRVVSGAAGG